MSQADVVWAFVGQSQGTKQYVSFAKRGHGPRAYINVFGPSHNPAKAETARVVIEHDGAVSFKDAAVAKTLKAQPRGSGATAPSTGAAKWGLSVQSIATTYGTADRLVTAIVRAMTTHASW